MWILPQNINSVYNNEEQFSAKSLSSIESEADLLLNIKIVESAIDICQMLRLFKTNDQDLTVIQVFSLHIFNAFASSIKLMMSGYYQNSALIIRDILGTVFLADFFCTNDQQITRWHNGDKKERNRLTTNHQCHLQRFL